MKRYFYAKKKLVPLRRPEREKLWGETPHTPLPLLFSVPRPAGFPGRPRHPGNFETLPAAQLQSRGVRVELHHQRVQPDLIPPGFAGMAVPLLAVDREGPALGGAGAMDRTRPAALPALVGVGPPADQLKHPVEGDEMLHRVKIYSRHSYYPVKAFRQHAEQGRGAVRGCGGPPPHNLVTRGRMPPQPSRGLRTHPGASPPSGPRCVPCRPGR